jgi:hypothetical protein
MESVTLTREQLYEQVWSTPMSTLAGRYGISDVALAKTCKKHDIPRPGRGYWAQLAAGQKPARMKLPKLRLGTRDRIVLNKAPRPLGEPRPVAPDVKVSERLVDPHEVVRWLADTLEEAATDKYGRLIVGPAWSPDVCLRKACSRRALVLLDALCKALAGRGHQVEAKQRNEHHTTNEITVRIVDQDLSIQIEEKLAQKPHILTAEERQQKEKSGWKKFPKYDYFADGELAFRISGTHHKYTGHKSCSDTRTQQLDNRLGYFVLALEQAAQVGRQERLEAEQRQREWAAQERKRLRGERMLWYQRHVAEDLERMASNWEKAQQIRHFLGAYEVLLAGDRIERDAVWLTWAKAYADRLDPLHGPSRVAKAMEPSDEDLARLVTEWKTSKKAKGTTPGA